MVSTLLIVSGKYRLVAVDLDGTLLSSSHEIPAENHRALADCAAAGVAVAIVTGRRFPGVLPYLRALDLDAFVVANSGAIIKEGIDGPILRRRLLARGVAERVLHIADQSAMEAVLHDGPNAEGHLILRESARELPHLARYLSRATPPPSWTDVLRLERDPVQIGFANSVSEIRSFITVLTTELGARRDEVSLARTEYPVDNLALLDVLATEATKSAALWFLSERLGIKMSETIAIGDNWNDLDMLEHAGMGVVMQNATHELRGRGFQETGTNDEAGVAQAIRRHVL